MVPNPKSNKRTNGRERGANCLDGLSYIKVLRSRPGKPIPAATLYGWDQSCPYKYIDDDPDYYYIQELDAYFNEPERAIEMTDPKTLNDVKGYLKGIAVRIDEAVANNDYSKADDLRDEEEHCLKYLNETSTPSGDIKMYPGQNDKSRRNIKQAVEYYLKKLDQTDPAEAELIRSCLTIGSICMWSEH